MKRGFFILGAFYVLSSVSLSRVFPPVNPDEVLVAVHGYNLVTGHGQRYSLYDAIFAPEVYPLRDAFLEVTRPVYDAWVGIWTALRKSPRGARASSWTAGVLALFGFYLMGSLLRGPRFGLLLAAIVLLNPVFWAASCIVRPELLLLAVSAALLVWMLKGIDGGWKQFAAGTLAGLAVGIHPNIIPLFGGLTLSYLYWNRAHRLQTVILLASGFVAGSVLVLGCIDIHRFLLCRQTIQYQATLPPLLSHPWTPAVWLTNTFTTFLSGPTYYFDSRLADGWHAALRLHWIGILLCLLNLFLFSELPSPLIRRRNGLAIGGVGCLLLMVLLINRQESLYALLLAPFVIPLAGMSLLDGKLVSGRLHRLFKTTSALFWVAGLLFFSHFVIAYTRLSQPYGQWTREVVDLCPRNARVAGPNMLWFSLPTEQFQDIGALMMSRYYTGATAPWPLWLARWRPDVLVIDPFFNHLFLPKGLGVDELKQALHQDVTLLGVVDSGVAAGTLTLYQVHWR